MIQQLCVKEVLLEAVEGLKKEIAAKSPGCKKAIVQIGKNLNFVITRVKRFLKSYMTKLNV